MPMLNLYSILIIVFLTSKLSYSQSQDIKFEHISVEHGLSHEIVRCILQDRFGFMWFGTEQGVCRYDGYKFTIYRHDPDNSTTIGGNYITTLFEDKKGVIWVGTLGGGLNKFNREKNSFTRFLYNPQNPDGISSNSTEQIAEYHFDGRDILWIGSAHGLNRMDMTTEEFEHFLPSDKPYPYNYIESLVLDSSGNVWIGCARGGLYKFDPKTEEFTHQQFDPKDPHSSDDNTVMSLFLDQSGTLWVGTFEGGVYKFEQNMEKFTHYQHNPKDPFSLSSNFVVSIHEDHNGILWIGTANGGLNKFNKKTGQFIRYRHDSGDPTSLCDNSVVSIYEDRSGVLWLGTWGGINKIDPRKSCISDFKQLPGNPNSLNDSHIWSIYESCSGGKRTLWIGTKTGGLSKLDRNTGQFTHYLHDPNDLKSIPSDNILSLFEDREKILWIGTYGDGLIKYDQRTHTFYQYLHDPENPHTISCNIIQSIFEDRDGVIWISTRTGGLNKYTREIDQFKQIGYRWRILKVIEDHTGILWIATRDGLKKLDRKTEELITYRHDPEDPTSISINQINCMYESHSGVADVIWIGTSGGGLNKFDFESETFKHYNVKDGLSDNVIYGILEDDHGNLWMSTNKGLSRFNPVTEKFRNYDAKDGFLNTQFNFGVCFKGRDGELLFGSSKGLNAFYPNDLIDNSTIPEVVITNFQIFNDPVPIDPFTNGMKISDYTLPKHISTMKKIKLSYWQNVFSFEFAALDFRSPEKNQYAYRMEGFEKNWNHTDANRRFVTYTNLDPGEYTFKVKGSNNDGLWNNEGTSIKIIISPPWWKTQLAYILYFVFCISLVVVIWRAQLRRIRLRQQFQMEHFEAEKLREVDQLKSRFFANISHEFRTPLTLIKGPVKQIMDGEFTGNLKNQCKMILRNSDRLLGLINQILDLSKLESGEMKLTVSETDIVKYFKGLVLSFSSLAERNKIKLQFKVIEKSIVGYVDFDKLEKIVTNLLSNAFKFTPAGGTVEVKINTPLPSASPLNRGARLDSSLKKGDKGGCLELTISNTGAGIPENQLDKIFDRFYQTDNNYKSDSEGTGIGLALTKELVESHHGNITVTSIPDKITTFSVEIPISKENYNENEIVDTPPTSPGRLRRVAEDYTESAKIEQKSNTKKSIPLLLIVEDNPDVTNYISSFMEKDYRIVTAENGSIGMKKTLDKYPDLIISDVMMPMMDGFEFCEKVKSDERLSHIPVILLTAKADLESKINGLEFGADDYVTKPFEARELQIRSKNLIEQRRKLREKFSSLIDLKPEDIATSSMDEQLLQRLLSVFEDHIEEPEFNTSELAREVGLSRMHLNRKIQALTNLSTNDFIRTLRLQRAALLLRSASGNVSEVAYKVGFNNLSHFSKAFRKHFGQLPSEIFAEKK